MRQRFRRKYWRSAGGFRERNILTRSAPCMSLLGHIESQGRNADAANIQEEVLEKRRRISGEEHPDTLGAMHTLASTYQAQGRNVDAAKIQEEVLEKQQEDFGRGTS